MKKFFTITSLITFFVNFSSFATTSGNYVGIDLLGATAHHRYMQNKYVVGNYSKFSDSVLGYGINYKHAFNRDKLFIAPGVFFDRLGTKAADQNGDTVAISNRYGVRVDLGYDVTDKAAIYLAGGLASINYKVNWNSLGEQKSDSRIGYLFALGTSYKLNKDFSLNLEYNVQTLSLATPNSGSINRVKTNIGVAKIGLGYHF